jgi:predicted RNase H-like nuclease (RuvC/YqgF family)
MRSTTLLRLAALLALATFAALPALAQQDQSADPVADAARKAREQKKNAPSPKKVYTNDDIAPAAQTGPAPAAKPSGDASQATDTDTSAAGSDDDKVKNPEVYWHKRFQKARYNLAKAEKELDVLQRELDKNQVQYYSDPQKALMQQHDRSDINGNEAKIDAKKKEIDSLNQQLADMEDELRKSGGNPGWAR